MRSLRLTLLFSLLLGFGCGDDGGSGDAGLDFGEIEPNTPAGIEVMVTPGRSYYRTEQAVRVVATVIDIDEVVLEGAAVTITASPASAATDLGDGNFMLNTQGFVVFDACTVDDSVTGEPLCDSVQILVDDGAPNLEVTSPTPGQELGAEGEDVIVVTGSVADSRTPTVFVNGVPAELDEMGMFRGEVTPLFGVNHLEIVASDEISDQARIQMDVMWSDRYNPSDEGENPSVTLDEGITLQLGQAFFDDGAPLDLDATPLTTRDLAGIFELVLANLDFMSFLPNPLIDSSALRLNISSVDVTDVTVEVDVVEGGVELFVRFGSMVANTNGNLDFEGSMLDLGGSVGITASAFASLTVTKADVDSPVVAEVDSLEVAIEDISGNFADDQANAILALAESFFRTTLENELRAGFNDSLVDALPAILGGALNGLDTALRDQTIPLETDIFPALTISLDARLARLETQRRRWLRAPLRFQIGTDAAIVHGESRGAVDLLAAADPLFDGIPVQMGVRLLVLNGLLHTLWNSGLLEIDATNLLPDSIAGAVEEAVISGRMAPIVRPSRGAESNDLQMAIGQMELRLQVLEDITTFGITIEAGADLNVADGAVALELAETPRIRTWIIESNTPTPLIDDDALQVLLEGDLWTQIRDAVTGGIMFELPSLDVGDLSGLAPELAGFALSIDMNDRLDVREDSAVLDLAIVGSLP
ncbi:MAG: hypothetical protein JJ863_10205 [Deltaproteobacteria bacterium]|nr:hypothetical protein [Deltaproteobacteria bacterium]